MRTLVDILGRILHSLPDGANRLICLFVAFFIMTFMRSRRRLLISNIARSFPSLSSREVRKLAWESAARTAELGLFVLVSPRMDNAEITRRFAVSDYVKKEFEKISKNPRPVVLLVPHFTMMESVTILPHLLGGKIPRTGVFYRPFDIPWLEDWVLSTRGRFGIDLLSRKNGLSQAFDYLRSNGCVAILFDQNAGSVGAVKYLFDRITSSSGLSGMLAENFKADAYICYARRTGFWKSIIDGEHLTDSHNAQDVVISADMWLENALKTDSNLRADWLWMHGKWNMHHGGCLFSIRHRLDYLKADAERKNMRSIPRNTRFELILPEDFESLLVALPFVRTLRSERFESCFEAVVSGPYAEFVKYMRIADSVEPVCYTGWGFVKSAFLLRKAPEEAPDYTLLFDGSFKAGVLAWVLGAIQTFGFGLKKRFSCKKTCIIKKLSSPRDTFLRFFNNFACCADVDFSSFNTPAPAASKIAVLVPKFEGKGRVEKLCLRMKEEFPEVEFVEILRDVLSAARTLEDVKCAVVFDSMSASFASVMGVRCIVCSNSEIDDELIACSAPRRRIPLSDVEEDIGAAITAARNFCK